MKKIVLAAAVLAATSAPAFAADGTGEATATVIAPIAITHVTNAKLAFGSFLVGTGGTVVVDAAGAGSVTGDVSFVTGSTNRADAFDVTGDPGRGFSITTTGGSVSDGTNTISFTTAPAASSSTLNATGSRRFFVGGTLTLTGSEVAGDYTGSYTATVEYN